MVHSALERVSETCLNIRHSFDFPAQLFATPQVPLERRAANELLNFLEVAQIARQLSPAAQVKQVAVTPDFHKGAGIPVGTVIRTEGFFIPQATGNDIGCGMRLHTTAIRREQLEPHLDALEGRLRYLFFGGGRDLAMTGRQREALLRHGVPGLRESVPAAQDSGLWSLFQRQDARTDAHMNGSSALNVTHLPDVQDWLGAPDSPSRDAQTGSLGGGNHFAEVQYVQRILEPQAAYAWGLREGEVVVMIHSGSLGFGQRGGELARKLVRGQYPAHLKAPENGIYPLLTEQYDAVNAVQSAVNAAANFAGVNRMFLALMVQTALEEHLGKLNFPLVYDAAHNFIWAEADGSWLHRKGATPAQGFEAMQDTPFAFTGEPVLVPGSMGASSFVLAGRGLECALSSASHGAGRVQGRGAAMHGHEAEFEAFLRDFRVVTPLDWKRARADIRAQKIAELKQEAPFAYKGIGPVIETLERSGIAQPVAELRPLLTVKG